MELCGWFWRLVLRIRLLEWVVRLLTKPMAPISMCVLMRARYAEQTLEQAVEDGVTQYAALEGRPRVLGAVAQNLD